MARVSRKQLNVKRKSRSLPKMTIINDDDEKLPEVVQVTTEGRPVRVYADGIFDLFHFGHARALEQAKKSYTDTSGSGNDVYEFVKAIGKFKEMKRTEGISTSDIIMRVLRNYNQCVMRNSARGYSRKDLGLSFVMEKQLKVNMRINRFCEMLQEQQENVGKKLDAIASIAGTLHCEWMDNADNYVARFLKNFEEECHKMEIAIKCRISERLKNNQLPWTKYNFSRISESTLDSSIMDMKC